MWIESNTKAKRIVDLSKYSVISYVKEKEPHSEQNEYNLYGYYPNGDYDLIWIEPTKERIEIIFNRIKSILGVNTRLHFGMEEREVNHDQ
jgi:hypothetical protein